MLPRSSRPRMRINIIDALASIPQDRWDALHDGRNPFISHAFLCGLEQHGCLRDDYGRTKVKKIN